MLMFVSHFCSHVMNVVNKIPCLTFNTMLSIAQSLDSCHTLYCLISTFNYQVLLGSAYMYSFFLEFVLLTAWQMQLLQW